MNLYLKDPEAKMFDLKYLIVLLIAYCCCCTYSFQYVEASNKFNNLWARIFNGNEGKVDNFQLTSVEQLEQMFLLFQQEQQFQDDSIHSEQTKLAITSLYHLVSKNQDDVCSMSKVDEISQFAEKYLQNSHDKRGDLQVPKYLRNFFIAYGLQVSATCEQSMIKLLASVDENYKLDEYDYGTVDKWANDTSAMVAIFRDTNDYDDILLPREIIRSSGGNGHYVSLPQETDTKLTIISFTGSIIARMKLICQRRFKPIYEHSILPLIDLSLIGFKYKSKNINSKSANKLTNRWYRIVHVCEALEHIDLFRDPEMGNDDANMRRRQTVRILSKEEAKEMRENAEQVGQQIDLMTSSDLPWVDQVEFRLEDKTRFDKSLILDVEDKKLIKLINKFDESKTEVQRMEKKINKRLARFLWKNLKQGKLRLEASDGDLGRELVVELDKYFNRPDESEDGNISLGSYLKRKLFRLAHSHYTYIFLAFAVTASIVILASLGVLG